MLTKTLNLQKSKPLVTKGRPGTITETGRLAEIRTCVQICLDLMDSMKPLDIARRTGLSLSTVYHLINGEVSLASHVGTIQALGYAAGVRIELTETKITLALAKK